MAKKKVIGFINLQVPAGQANPAPPVGPALGQKGLNIMEFCKAFNAATQGGTYEPGTPIPVTITAYGDRTFTFVTRTPPASYYLKKAAKQKKGATSPNIAATVATVKKSQVREIAELKMKDLSAYDVDQAMKIIEGSARSMGYAVVED